MSFNLTYLLGLILFSFVVIIIYNVLKIYVLQKFKPNKWVIFAIAILFLAGPSVIRPGFNTTIWGYVTSGIFVMLFLWFFDLFNEDRLVLQSKRDNIKIKPKAKPNRIKDKENKGKK